MKVRSFYHIPLSSLQWLLTGLFLSALPLNDQIPYAVIFGFLACLLWRFILERNGLKCPSLWARIGTGAAGLLMIYGLHGTVVGVQAGMGLLLLLIALKVLEMKSEREFLILAFLAYFVLLTSLFFSQTLQVFLYVATVFLILTAAILHFTGGSSEGFRLGQLLRHTGMLVLQCTPLIALLFVFMPRMKGGLWLKMSKSNAAQSGMSEQINPGSFAELALSDEIAFRAEFPEGPMPPQNQLYWRVAVFSECHGLSWRRDTFNRQSFAPIQLTGPIVVQRISMEPHNGPWVYALDRPESESSSFVSMGPGHVLEMPARNSEALAPVRVVSRLGNDRTPLSSNDRYMLTQAPEKNVERSRLLVNSWLKKTQNPRSLIALALGMFRDEDFRYTLSPGAYGDDGLDTFLFERKLGFCEHYAAAFATLMRMTGLPTRMVGGYHGGELNTFGDYLIVRQADAHAWAEVWIDGDGWVRFDPADSVNPLRMDDDTQLASRHRGDELKSPEMRRSGQVPDIFQSALRNVRLAWDTVSFQFNLYVISYDRSSQIELFRSLGIRSLLSWRLLTILLGGLLVILVAVWWMVRLKPVRKDRSLILYQRFCSILGKAGITRRSEEGPREFSIRAMAACPQESARIAEAANMLIALRYGKNPGEVDQAALVGKLKEIRQYLKSAKQD